MKRDDEIWDGVIAAARQLPQPFTTRQLNQVMAAEGNPPRNTTSVVQQLAYRGTFRCVGKANSRDRLYRVAAPRPQRQPKLSPTEAAWREFRSTLQVKSPDFESYVERSDL